MIRTSLGAFVALAIAAMVGAVALLAQPGSVEAQSHSATRTFQQDWASPGGVLQVTITASNYGGFGQMVETLPAGFTFVSSTLPLANQTEVEGQVINFNLFGDSSFIYVVTVPTTEGQYIFSGIFKNFDRQERTVAGHTQVRVGPPPTPAPPATSTPEPAATSTPEPAATSTPEPTETPTPEPTATPTPEPTATPTPEPTATSTPAPTPTPEPTAAPMATATPAIIIVTPTATSAPAPAPAPDVAEGDGGLPGILWFIPVILLFGLILGVFSYLRTRS